jgi:hypothetical protein
MKMKIGKLYKDITNHVFMVTDLGEDLITGSELVYYYNIKYPEKILCRYGNDNWTWDQV